MKSTPQTKAELEKFLAIVNNPSGQTLAIEGVNGTKVAFDLPSIAPENDYMYVVPRNQVRLTPTANPNWRTCYIDNCVTTGRSYIGFEPIRVTHIEFNTKNGRIKFMREGDVVALVVEFKRMVNPPKPSEIRRLPEFRPLEEVFGDYRR